MPDAQNEERMFVPSLQNLLLQVWLLSDLAISLETWLKAMTPSVVYLQSWKCQDDCCDGNQSPGCFCRVGLYIFNEGHVEDRVSPLWCSGQSDTQRAHQKISCFKLMENTWLDRDTGDSLQGGAGAVRLTWDMTCFFFIYTLYLEDMLLISVHTLMGLCSKGLKVEGNKQVSM